MRDRLEDWEDYLALFFGRVRLLGEIPVSRFECDQIGGLIHELIDKEGQTGATRRLEEDYPRTFAVYLVAMGIHHYREGGEGGYWTSIEEVTGIQNPHQLKWGPRFLNILRANGLPDFAGVRGNIFVMPILAHGGIPARSLPDFFRYIVRPSIVRPELATAPASEVIAKLVDLTTTQQSVDKPACRYLKLTGSIGAEYLERARRMARTYLDTQELPEAEEIGLPPYVIEAFRRFMEDEPEAQTGKRLRAPRLCLDPWSAEFAVYLPPEPVKGAELSRGSYEWHIETQTAAGDVLTEVRRVRCDRQGYDIITRKEHVVLDEAVAHVTLAFCQRVTSDNGDVEQQVLRHWKLHLRPSDDQVPLLAFRQVGSDWQLLPWNQTLPTAEVILVYPTRLDLRPDTHEHERENYQEFSGPWYEWRAQRWDLTHVGVFHLFSNGVEAYAPIPIEHQPPDPLLVGGKRVEADVDTDEVPVYIGEPPCLRFPLHPDRLSEDDRQRWEIGIKSLWAARPVIVEQHNTLAYFDEQIVKLDDAIELPLRHILGTQACGTYQLRVTSSSGVVTDLRFRIWPSLQINGLQPYYLPSPDGSEPVRFSMHVADGCLIEPQAGVEGVQIAATPAEFEVTVDPATTVAELHLIDPHGSLEPIRLPLALAVPRLRWTLLRDQDAGDLQWLTSPLRLSVDELRQAKRADLYIELPVVGDLSLEFDLCLVDLNSGTTLQSSESQTAHHGQTRWRFSLGQFMDTLRHAEDAPLLEFQLEIADYQANALRQVPVLYLTRLLGIRAVSIEHRDEVTFCLHWEELRPLRNRRVRIWAEWQPWNLPLEFKIPDEARGEFTFEAALPESRYRLQFFTAAEWENREAEWPVRIPPDTHLVETATAQERLGWINRHLEIETPRAFALHFERACISSSLQDAHARQSDIDWCYQHLDQAAPDQAVAFHDWLSTCDIYTQKAVRLKLFHPVALAKLYQQRALPPYIRERYVENVLAVRPTMLKPESARLLLAHEKGPAITLHALQALIIQSDTDSVQQVLQMAQNGQLAEVDAIDLLTRNPALTLQAIAGAPKSPFMQRIVYQFSKHFPDQQNWITTCMWVHTEAGWGLIDQIVEQASRATWPYFNPNDEEPLLVVTLRPTHHPETILVDLHARTIMFDSFKVYVCARQHCQGFISESEDLLYRNHTRSAHPGLGASLRQESPPIKLRRPVEYAQEAPDDEMA